jgi:molybdopterin-containing oxidoreductase family iron-sulfur binding subunit
MTFGRAHRVHLRLDQARILLDLDSDLFGLAPDALNNSRGFAAGRDADGDRPLNRSYSVEARHTASGASADHRLPLRSAQIGAFLAALEAKLVADGGLTVPGSWGSASSTPSAAFLGEPHVADFLTALSEDLLAHQGASAIVVGADQPAEVQALGFRVNALLGNLGNGQLAELAQGIEGGQITKLLVIGGNPVYDAPGDIDFGALMERLEASVVLSLYMDETARKATWQVPAAHWLESWGDSRAYNGSYLISQPLLRPLYGGKSALEVVDYLANGAWRDGQQIVRESFSRQPGVTDERAWKRTLHDGFLAGSELPALSPSGRAIPALELGATALAGSAAPQNGNLEFIAHADAKVYDGRFANSGWLQELPDFMTKMCWDNAALIAPATATQLDVTTGDLVELTLGGRTLESVAYVMPGQAQGSVSLALGYGRTSAGQVGGSVHDPVEIPGFDASQLTAGTAIGAWQGLQVTKTGKTYPIAMTQEHHQVDAAGMKERDQDQGPVKSRVAELIHETDAENWGHIKDEYASGSLLGLYRGGDPLHHGEEGHGDHGHDDHSHDGDGHGEAHGGPGGGGHGPKLNELQSFVGPELKSIWDEKPYEGDYAWGMSIDLNSCTGCNACVIACQAENNIPVVGKEQVMRGREMHWLRIDRYFKGDQDRPEVRSQPVGCIQCENAPCEQVCPVAATVHSPEGLNDMAYNRCIGTRYCSNNCPVKVRRFNFFNYHRELKEEENDVKRLSFNPEVSVRARGVMEKCTYCVQRIQSAKIQAKVEQRRVRDGEIETACQQVCPSESIVFGDLKTEGSKVRELQSSQRAYHMLAFLNIKPRTAYLSRITNPHPLLASHDSHESGDGAAQSDANSETHAETPVGADH